MFRWLGGQVSRWAGGEVGRCCGSCAARWRMATDWQVARWAPALAAEASPALGAPRAGRRGCRGEVVHRGAQDRSNYVAV